jgi:lactoylglutathione lyase
LTKSIEFYTKVLGFRELFTLPATEHMKIAYLGHAQGGRNGTGYQKTEELNREKNNNAGLIEMIELNVPNRHLPASSEKSNTLGHLGIVVPDVKATQARLEAMEDVEILKNTGDPTPSEGKIAMSNGFPPEVWAHISVEERRMIEGLSSQINKEFIYISDPDGNVIEIQPQVAGV